MATQTILTKNSTLQSYDSQVVENISSSGTSNIPTSIVCCVLFRFHNCVFGSGTDPLATRKGKQRVYEA